MKKLLEFLRRAVAFLSKPWHWLVKVARNKDFVLGFPSVIFALSAVACGSFVLFLAWLLWFIPIVKGIDEGTE